VIQSTLSYLLFLISNFLFYLTNICSLFTIVVSLTCTFTILFSNVQHLHKIYHLVNLSSLHYDLFDLAMHYDSLLIIDFI